MPTQVTLDGAVGGEYSSVTDPNVMPSGVCLRLGNLALRNGPRLEGRAPFVYDGLMSIRSLATFDDTKNKVFRMIAVDGANPPAVSMKATSGDAYIAPVNITGASAGRVTSIAHYRGNSYMTLDDGAGTPATIAMLALNGTTPVLTNAPLNSVIAGRTIIAYLDRTFILYPHVTVTPLNAIAQCYGSGWAATNAFGTLQSIVAGSTTLVRAFLLNTTQSPLLPSGASSFAATFNLFSVVVPGSSSDTNVVLRIDYRNNDAINSVPVQLNVGFTGSGTLANLAAGGRLFPAVVGDVGTAASTTVTALYRCVVAGLTAAGAPAFAANPIGSTIVDGAATWLAESPSFLTLKEVLLPSGSAWTTAYCPFTVPRNNYGLTAVCSLIFGNTARPNIVAATSVDVAYKDGLADGNPAKQNRGVQLTLGTMYVPFVNTETATSTTYDLNQLIWSDIQQPLNFRASSTYDMWAKPGYPTAGVGPISNRLVAAKRNSLWIFMGNQDSASLDYVPVRLERLVDAVGVIGPRAIDTHNDDMYFISEDTVCHFTVDMPTPEDIAGPGMRETIMDRGSNWVESQATYNMPILRVNERDREIWVYTQKGTIFVYSLERKQWTRYYVTVNEVQVEVADMWFNRNTRKMYVAWGGYGVARCDWSVAPAQDTIDNTVNTYSVSQRFVTKPFETRPRRDLLFDRAKIYHTVLPGQNETGNTLTASISFDRGQTYPYTSAITLDVATGREQGNMNAIELYETAASITLDVTMSGKTGAAIYGVTRIEVEAQALDDEFIQAAPTQGSATL